MLQRAGMIPIRSISPSKEYTKCRRLGTAFAWPLAVVLGVLGSGMNGGAQSGTQPTAVLVPATTLRLPGAVDSNSPAVWDLVDGRRQLRVITSTAGRSALSAGPFLIRLGGPTPLTWSVHPGDGVWIESIAVDDGGTWYGVYHNEIPAAFCGRLDRAMARIGIARSYDSGATWEDLGIVLEAPPGYQACTTQNRYFVGGVGDANAVLDRESKYLYLFFSQYSRGADKQGIACARMAWAARDEPVGRLEVWNRGAWLPATPEISSDEAGGETVAWFYGAGTPLTSTSRPWHDNDSGNDAFWGASVHWNTRLQMYVMLLNRTKDESWGQQGVYIAYSRTLDDPGAWSAPELLVTGGEWYPQVIGLEPGRGSDREAGGRARYFQGGTSSYFIDFSFK